jgi:C4-dicarboxylate transporter
VRAVVTYGVLRLALFVAALGLLALLGATQLTALLGAALVSALLSYLLLRRPREAAAGALAARTQARLSRPRTDRDAAAEDAQLAALEQEPPGT